jgi:hypothetical protein
MSPLVAIRQKEMLVNAVMSHRIFWDELLEPASGEKPRRENS